jgi:hypothetical protein
MITICFDAPSSLISFGFVYIIAFYFLRKNDPHLKWGAVALMGITAMQLVEGLLWLDGPTPYGMFNKFATVVLIPLALLTQPWGPLFGSLFVVPLRQRRTKFFLLLTLGLVMVIITHFTNNPIYTQVTPQGHLNWFSQCNPPVFSPWSYGLWALVIGAPFLLWWRPFWQSLLIVSWGWVWAVIAFIFTDSAASFWCFFVSFYALFVLIYSFRDKDKTESHKKKSNKSVDRRKRRQANR